MVFQHLAASVGAVAFMHGTGPDTAGDASYYGVFRIHTIAEKETQVRCEFVDVHTAGKVILDDGEAVAQGKGQLADRVRTGFGDVVAGDRNRVKIAYLVIYEILLDVTHHAHRELGGEDTGVLGLVFLEDIGLHGAAYLADGLSPDTRIGVGIHDLVTSDTQ